MQDFQGNESDRGATSIRWYPQNQNTWDLCLMPCRDGKRGRGQDARGKIFSGAAHVSPSDEGLPVYVVLTSKLVLLVAGELLRGLEVVRDELDFPLEEGMCRLHSLHRLENMSEARTGKQQAERAVDVFVIEHEGRSVSLAMGLNQCGCRKLQAASPLLWQPGV